jgi:hypothetical protein
VIEFTLLISAQRMDSAFLDVIVPACSRFRLQSPFECMNFFEKENQDQNFFSGPSLASKQAFSSV